ncbi:flagellar basal-body rod protein FlgF [Desulfofustis glycolicus]|uniref:Flagellar basal-body rod protein FlgG n=1 Tax=Desulfofustis glycolicus DSM 9705 TaxID=1121409 RepID=A0A1M5U0V1_9BACT|nr:flagellar basal-body rod protein FlgF [Desulfofustis glycolicus]MCB2214723.1 flagellar basal-body rod protein FlgF [Desulfobulbaceae bacterium]SHH56574.1 flagellar basal-body rod protein FlgG [Desulfofustis glycolicus DSM 9705]
MVSGKYSALAGAVSREQSLANTSHNLANVSTTGYKRMMISFESILRGEQQTSQANGINYNRIKHNFSDFNPGPLKDTGNPLDVAVQGPGFFKVLGPDGPLLTRNGAFVVDQDGALRTQNGYAVLNQGDAPIELGEAARGTLSISGFGVISSIDAQGNREELDQLAVVDVDNPAGLQRREQAAFALGEDAIEQPVEEPTIVSGSLEIANVNMVEEMAQMVDSHRLYEIYLKAIKAYSTISEKQEDLGTLS